MRSLILYRDDKLKFDPHSIMSVAHKTSGVTDILDDGSDFCTLKFHFRYDSDQTIVRLSEDCKAVQITGTGIASQWIAWVVQEYVGDRLHMIDTDYSFDIELWAYPCFDNVRNIVEGKCNGERKFKGVGSL